jgi:dTMP kinase
MYVSFEGIDGSGKTKVSTALSNRLGAQLVREPSHFSTGTLLRSVLKGESERLCELSMAYLFAADRAELIEKVINKYLEAGQLVISDRCFLSTVCYQGTVGNLSSLDILQIHNLVKKPDAIIILDISIETSMTRVGRRGDSKEIYEEFNILEEVKKKYNAFNDLSFPPTRIFRVNTEKPFEEVLDECEKICKTLL